MKIKKNNLVCFVAGKSAGHILPALTIANNLKVANVNTKIIFFSNHTKLDFNLLKNNPNINRHIALRLMQIPYQKPWRCFTFAGQIIKSLWSSYQVLKTEQPRQIISTGGLVSIPICLIGKYLKIPVTVYELNVEPGKATKFIAHFADEVKVCFQKTKQFLTTNKCTLTPYPTRFTKLDYTLTKKDALNFVKQDNPKFSQKHKTILILGGSQGSLFINELIHKFISQYKNDNLQIIHQIGQNDNFNWHSFYLAKKIPAIAFSYQSNLMPYYIAADLIICRAGAGTLAEITPLNTPCVIIPLQTGYTSHQLDNAIEVANDHLQIEVLKQNDVQQNFNIFYNHVSELLH
jgi:UDP-N-acetylglucosamine--N-acetylmuramyl-(pentapeptide) pyrophosphoryl-undecaprenol N-acetylglucosamine transferase